MKLRIVVGVVAIVAVLALAWVFGVQPQLAQAQQDAQSRAAYEQLTGVYQNRLQALRADKRNLPALQAQLSAAEAYIPTSPALGDFLTELNQLESQFGVHVTAYTASDPVAATGGPSTATAASTSPATAAAAAAPASVVLYEIPVQVQVEGPYSKIVGFTGALEKGSRLFIGNKITIGASQSGAGFSGTIVGDVFVAPAAR